MQVNVEEVLRKIHEEKDPIVQAELIDRAVNAGIRVVQIANELDMSSSYVSHLRRLKKLPEVVINGYYDKTVTLSHLFILSRLSESDEMIKLYEAILTQNLSASQTERKVFELLSGKKISGSKLSKEWFSELKKSVTKIHPAITVSTAQTRRSGEIRITFKGSQDQTSIVFEKIKRVLEMGS